MADWIPLPPIPTNFSPRSLWPLCKHKHFQSNIFFFKWQAVTPVTFESSLYSCLASHSEPSDRSRLSCFDDPSVLARLDQGIRPQEERWASHPIDSDMPSRPAECGGHLNSLRPKHRVSPQRAVGEFSTISQKSTALWTACLNSERIEAALLCSFSQVFTATRC